jgi:hypothetical protein
MVVCGCGGVRNVAGGGARNLGRVVPVMICAWSMTGYVLRLRLVVGNRQQIGCFVHSSK